MYLALKYIKKLLNVVFGFFLIIFLLIFAIFAVSHDSNIQDSKLQTLEKILPFSMNEKDITYNKKEEAAQTIVKNNYRSMTAGERTEVINRAKSMAEVNWTPKYDIYDDKGNFTFKKGKTYSGIPYSMDLTQAKSSEDFLNKIKDSNDLYGNDCSGYVSAAWGIKRQTTLSLYDAVKSGTPVDGKLVCQIPWEELQLGDALLVEDGKGKGHIMLYIDTDKNNSDNLNVYEQNIQTSVPYFPLPTARRDVRSKSTLIKIGYFPIRLLRTS